MTSLEGMSSVNSNKKRTDVIASSDDIRNIPSSDDIHIFFSLQLFQRIQIMLIIGLLPFRSH